MSDKYNETNDDFFAKFDEIADKKNKISETDTYSADAADAEYSYGSASSYRSDKKTSGSDKAPSKKQRRSDKKNGTKTKSAKPKKAAASKAKKSFSSAKAKGIAASSKFGGSASGQTKRKPLKRDTAGKAFLKTFVAIALIAVFAVGIYVGFIFLKAPAINTDDIYSQISQRSIMYDTDGNEIESLYFSNGNRTVIKYKDIPYIFLEKENWITKGVNFILRSDPLALGKIAL